MIQWGDNNPPTYSLNNHHIMNISHTEICEGLNTFCIKDDEGNEYMYVYDVEDDSIQPVVDFSRLGDNGIRIFTEQNQYEVEF